MAFQGNIGIQRGAYAGVAGRPGNLTHAPRSTIGTTFPKKIDSSPGLGCNTSRTLRPVGYPIG